LERASAAASPPMPPPAIAIRIHVTLSGELSGKVAPSAL
jgi:hypothetical protein